MGNEMSLERVTAASSTEVADHLASAMSCGGGDDSCVPAYKGVDRNRLKHGNPDSEPVLCPEKWTHSRKLEEEEEERSLIIDLKRHARLAVARSRHGLTCILQLVVR